MIDYLRATVLCGSVKEIVPVLQALKDNFELKRIKRRIRLTDEGNKAVLVNLVVEDPSFKPHYYEWSDWWKEGEVKMIAEV